jgi:HK97 family phage portal protein
VRLLGFQVPFTSKHTDANKVTPITSRYGLSTGLGWVYEAFGGAWQRGLTMDSAESMLAYSAVYSCISLISKDVGKLRPRLMALSADKIWEEMDVSAYSPVLRKPNRYQTRNQFYEQWLISKLVNGNTYVLKERDDRGVVRALYILDPRGVVPLIAPDGSVFYQFGAEKLAGLDVGENAIPASEIIHDRHTCLWHPLLGVGPLYACGASATQGNRIQANSAKFFENMSRPSGQLTAPGAISDDTAARLKGDFEKNFSGSNIGRLLVGGDGLHFEPFTMPAEQAQLIEQQRWTVEDVARAHQVPLYKIGAGQLPAFNNVGALNLEYYQQALQPHIEGIEVLLDEGLELKSGYGVEFDLDGLLRMDPKTRAETKEIEVRSAVLTPNEARRIENRPPLVGGGDAYLQEQNFSLAALAKRDALDNPWAARGAASAPAPATSPKELTSEETGSLATEELEKALCLQ